MLRTQNILSMTISPTKADFNMDAIGVKYSQLDLFEKTWPLYIFCIISAVEVPNGQRGTFHFGHVSFPNDKLMESRLILMPDSKKIRTILLRHTKPDCRRSEVKQHGHGTCSHCVAFRHVPFSPSSPGKCHANRQQIIDFIFCTQVEDGEI